MSINMSKERVVREGVKWLRDNLPKKTAKDISYTLLPQVKRLANSAERFSREQDSEINGRHYYRGKTFAFYLKIEKKYGLFGEKSLALGPKGQIANAAAFAKHGVTRGMFGTSTKHMVIGAIFIPQDKPRTAVDCTSYSNNIPFMIYNHPSRIKQREHKVSGNSKNRWSFHKPKFYSYCDDDPVQDQLDSNDSILRQKGF